ncbi:hypothetical protein ACFY2T_25070 [Streptomyces sp. NPDC001260]|uniref:hypothetical protein n=1 Tax=Streptomyces sp. NPDC001260 TaxID=3364551 RepID=UPI0036BC00F5
MSRTKGKAPRPRHGTRSGTETLPLIPPAPARPITDGGEADPVFVDSSGRRARRIRRVGYTAAGLCAAYTAVLALSFMGATPFAPRTVLPVPGVPSEEPGRVREIPGRHPPSTTTPPSRGGASPSPSDIPGVVVPGSSGTVTDPPSATRRPSAPSTTTDGTSPAPTTATGPPAGSGSPSGGTPTTSPESSGSPSATSPADGTTDTVRDASPTASPAGSPTGS